MENRKNVEGNLMSSKDSASKAKLIEQQEMSAYDLEQQEYINQLSDEELKELWEDRVASDAVDDMKNEYPDW